MALFSRRPKDSPEKTDETPDAAAPPDATADGATEVPDAADPAPHVGAAADDTTAATGGDATGDDATGDDATDAHHDDATGATDAEATDAEAAEGESTPDVGITLSSFRGLDDSSAAGTGEEPRSPASDADIDEDDAVSDVGISVSSFRGLGAPITRPPAEPATGAAFRPPQGIPGLADNAVLRDALARLPEQPQPQEVLDVARQVLQGVLYLRVKGDARALIAEKRDLPLAAARIGDRQYAIAYSSGGALAASIRADGDADTSAVGQPALAVLRHAVSSSADGLVIDPASAPARVILPRQLIERMLESADEESAIKTLLAGERTEGTAATVVEAMQRAPLWAAVGRSDEGAPLGLAEARSEDGSRYLEIASHPLEIVASGRGDQPAPITAVQLGTALARDEDLTGVVIDTRGPWLRLTRDDLAPIIALATDAG